MDPPLSLWLLAESWLSRTDPSSGQNLAATIHLGPRVWNPLFPSQLLFLRACSQKLCLPDCFTVACEQGQPSVFPGRLFLAEQALLHATDLLKCTSLACFHSTSQAAVRTSVFVLM